MNTSEKLGTAPDAVYSPWEARVGSWQELEVHLRNLFHHHDRQMLWRGARDARWGVFSSLYRTLNDDLGRPPTEGEMARSEKEIFKIARRDWRYDNMPGMELLAHLQHFGAPTRLLDVTYNPMVALWFAVEGSDDSVDARLFAFARPKDVVTLKNDWHGRQVPWIDWNTTATRTVNQWGTGRRRLVWRPPAYNPRIMSQNAAFMLDGVPFDFERSKADEQRPWERSGMTLNEWKKVASMSFQLSQIERPPLSEQSAPAFTLRIDARAKAEIRRLLEERYGYRSSTIYSDMSGLAHFVVANMGAIEKKAVTRAP